MYGLGIAFITFNTKYIADIVESNWSTKFNFSFQNIKKLFESSKYYTCQREGGQIKVPIKVDRAPNPNDLDWKDLGVSMTVVITRRVITYAITIILLGMSFGGMTGLKYGQYQMSKQTDSTDFTSSAKFRLISVLITLLIMIINYALSRTLRFLTFSERHWTETAFFQSLTIKMVVVNFVLRRHNSSTRILLCSLRI